MHVTQVYNAGLVQQWNAAHSHNPVQDLIVLEVNGKRGTFTEMNRALQDSTDKVCMVVSQRDPDNNVWTNGRLMLQNFISEPTLALSGKRYNRMMAMDGMKAAIGKIMAGETEVAIDSVTLELIHELAADHPELKKKLSKFLKVKPDGQLSDHTDL